MYKLVHERSAVPIQFQIPIEHDVSAIKPNVVVIGGGLRFLKHSGDFGGYRKALKETLPRLVAIPRRVELFWFPLHLPFVFL